MNILVWLRILGILVLIGSVAWLAVGLANARYDSENRPKQGLPVLVGLVALLSTAFLFVGATHIPGTHTAVVENTRTGQFSDISPGLHVFPMQPKLVPFMSDVTKYNLRRQILEIGSPGTDCGGDANCIRDAAIAADSDSPGRPPVYFHVRFWAQPNPDKVVELHKRYGANYLEDWVERNLVSVLKSVQGQKSFDFVGKSRPVFEKLVEERLQQELVDESGTPLVVVSQLAVVNFEFTAATNAYLDDVQKTEFARQRAEQQQNVNRAQQEADKIAAETSYLVETRNAERDRDAAKARADGEAYRIKQKYDAEAEGIAKVQRVLENAPEGYLEYQKTQQWDGRLPQYMIGGGAALPFIDITPK